MKISKILLAPHNDDEALFVAYTIMREKPLVLIITDSWRQYLRGDNITAVERRGETKRAMKKLGVECRFLGLPDIHVTKEKLTTALNTTVKDPQVVFAPMIEWGNKEHDIVGEVAHEMFSNVLHYSTYTKDRPYPIGDIEVKPTEKERKLKNEILEEYHTQKDHKFNKVYFEFARKRNEYFHSSRYALSLASTLTLKENTFRNLIDTKCAFDSLGIPFCLMDGTLLGAYRDGDFIPGDYDDTDIGFDVKYRDMIPSIFKKLNEFGLKPYKEWKLKGQFEGGAVARGGNHVDILCIHKRGKDAYNLGRNFLPNNPKEYMAYVYPAECFTKFDKLIFKGMEFNIPTKVETFLKARYGDWKTPLRRGEGFDWLNIEQNPALTADFELD